MPSSDDEVIAILSLDAGGSGAFSQLRILENYTGRLAFDLQVEPEQLRPCDHFDLITGVGTGGLIAIMFGCLQMTVEEVLTEFETLGRTVFAQYSGASLTSSAIYDGNRLRTAIEELVERRGLNTSLKMEDSYPTTSKARVMVGAVLRDDLSFIRAMRSYPSRDSAPFKGTLVEAACATMATQGLFEPAEVGSFPFLSKYIGPGITFGNPADQILKEARTVYGNSCQISVILSLGTGAVGALSQEVLSAPVGPSNILSHIAFHCDATARNLASQLESVDGYLRLNVEQGATGWTDANWLQPGNIATDTDVHMERPMINSSVERSVELLRDRKPTATVGQLTSHRIVATFSAAKAVPTVSPFFVPRKDAWNQMKKSLIVDTTPQRKLFVLHGMGGCGKTQLVAYFVHKYGSKYQHVLFIDATSKSTIRTDLQAAIRAFGIEHRLKTPEEGLTMLANDTKFKNWLIIFDNADDNNVGLPSYFPASTTHGAILVTTRNRELAFLTAPGYEWELGPMSSEEACETLHRASRRTVPFSPSEAKDANTLADNLGYLAVALVQAASYCFLMSSPSGAAPQLYTFGMYLRLLEPHRRELMKQAPSNSLDRYDRGVYATLDISYPKLAKGAKDLLRISAFFHRSDIPLIVFSSAFEGNFADTQTYLTRPSDHIDLVQEIHAIFSQDGQWNENYINKVVQNLRSFSLVSTTVGDSMVSLRFHRLVHAWARDSLDYKDANRFYRMTAVILSSCTGPQNTPLHTMMVPHVLELLQADSQISSLAALHVNDKAAFAILLLDSGRHSEAERLWTEVEAHVSNQQGADDVMAIEARANLASSVFIQGKWEMAEHLQRSILESRSARFGPTHPRTIHARACLANTFAKRANWTEAENEMVTVVEALQQLPQIIEESTLDDEIMSYNGISIDQASEMLVGIYTAQSKWTSALAKEEDLFEMRKRRYGLEHWKTLGSASNVGRFKSKLGMSRKPRTMMTM